MEQGHPRLSWSWTVDRRLQDSDYISVIRVLFSLLLDPDIDNIFKFPANDPQYGMSRIRLMIDDDWYITYSVDDVGNVQVYLLIPRSDIGPITPLELRRLS